MSIQLYPSIAKIKRNGVYENLPGFVPETGSIATQQMIATSESSATAQYVHEKGEYFRLNDTLYQAIVKINVGDAIVVGTNCEVAVIGNDLTHVANSIAAYELGIATSSHNTGDYFMVNETMYVATADIQVGDNISTSTNCRLAVVGDELSALQTAITKVYTDTIVSDIYGTNGAIEKQTNTDIMTGTWDSTAKTISVVMSESPSATTTAYTMMKPKLLANHTYKIAVKYNFYNDWRTVYIRNLFSTSNYNNRDDVINGTSIADNTEAVYTLTTTSAGWLSFGIRIYTTTLANWGFAIAVYDVTGIDTSEISNEIWLQLNDSVTIVTGGIVKNILNQSNYSYALDSNIKGETWSGLGDSLTASGNYLMYIKDRLNLSNYYNCGIGGTAISGTENTSAMYQDTRINSLNVNSNCVTVMGGTNDVWQSYYQEHPSTNLTGWGECVRNNYDVSTFCGAYNVLISKILYKFCLVSGYYSSIDYTGITQVENAVDNFRLILITPPQRFYTPDSTISENIVNDGIKKVHLYVKQIAELWGLPCVDSWEMGMNDMNKAVFFTDPSTDATHFNLLGHKRLASLVINKALQISRYE